MTTTTYEVKARIRPPRIAVLTSTFTTSEDFVKVFQFLSLVRGGVFARFMYADMTTSEFPASLRDEAKKSLPELVIPASPEDKKLVPLLYDGSRPTLLEVPTNPLVNFGEHATGGLVPWYRVVSEEQRKHPDLERNNLFLLSVKASDEFMPLVAATFGVLPDEIRYQIHSELQTEVLDTTVASAVDFYDLIDTLAHRVTWLDFINDGISRIHGAPVPPFVTVVSDQNPIRDIGHYWNARQHIAPLGGQESATMLRESDIADPSTMASLSRTLGSSRIGSNFCYIRTNEEMAGTARQAARRLRPRLRAIKGKSYYVDVNNDRVPSCYAYERELDVSISREDQIVTLPTTHIRDQTRRAFSKTYVDLTADYKTNRYPFDLAMAEDEDILDLLNVPAGSFFSFGQLLSLSDGNLSIAVSSSQNVASVRFQLPTAKEVFQIIFARDDWKLVDDEKNTRYSPFIALFDSIYSAATALTGRSWKIVDALQKGPLTNAQLRGKAKLGKENKSEPLSSFASLARQGLPRIYAEIFDQRYRAESGQLLSSASPDRRILEYLVGIQVLRRKWQLDRCPRCNQLHWTSDLDVTTTTYCPGCNSAMIIKDKVTVGYELNPLAKLALDEGVRPVLLTVRFLRNMTSHGYLWFPGAKIQKKSTRTDFDLIAMADGLLIAGECKQLQRGAGPMDKVWREVLEQLRLPVEIAQKIGVRIFFVSSLIDKYPRSFISSVEKLIGNSMITLFLTRSDLEAGDRKFKDHDGHEQTLHLNSLLYPTRKRRNRKKSKTPRRSMWF